MYQIIRDTQEKGGKPLVHSYEVFTQARSSGAEHYHVTGAPHGDYELIYIPDDELIPENLRRNRLGVTIYPSLGRYNADDVCTIDLSILNIHKNVYFDVIDEYSVIAARLALSYTETGVFFKDPAALDYLRPSERLHIVSTFPDSLPEDALLVVDGFSSGFFSNNYHRQGSVNLFNSLFFKQTLTKRPLKDIRYVELNIASNVSIGGILSYYFIAKTFFAGFGWDTFLKENATRYPDSLLNKYFSFIKKPKESNENNTVYVNEIFTIAETYACSLYCSEIDETILSTDFRRELDEYSDAVLGDGNVLGVLIRGTDYVVSKMSGVRKMATVEEMLPTIRKWIKEDGYEKIFLATEDQDILDDMRKQFGTSLIAVSQMRHKISDFDGVKLLSELEKKENEGEEYLKTLEDNTVNYFYALYILSRCKSFMCSGQCHGWEVVNSFNHGNFFRSFKFSVGLK